MRSALSSFVWYANKGYWPHIAELTARRIGLRARYRQYADRDKAVAWAAERAVPLEGALMALGLEAGDLPRIDPALLDEAANRAARSAVPMGGAGGIDLLYALTVLSGARHVIETGVAYGWSSLAILAAFRASGQPDARLVSVDMPYPQRGNEEFVGIAVPEELRVAWTLIREPDRNGLKKAIALCGGRVDLFHYDSDKSVYGRAYAYDLMWGTLKTGGLLVSDDIQDNLYFAHFSASTGVEPVVVKYRDQFVGVLKKP